MELLNSNAEKKAVSATNNECFAINLPDVKRAVTGILSLFGRNSIFQEYTTHDISHIDDMLRTADWIIPAETQSILTGGEWLTIVLAIYFHDMGLIVTDEEYKNRDNSGFRTFCEQVLFSERDGQDYKDKISALGADEQDKFLYQEFVRYNHAGRVRAWVEGRIDLEMGYTHQQVAEVNSLLRPLDKDFRHDLALICESHNKDDLRDTTKYRLWHPYGNTDDETVNLQYCAIILRTIDLVQITKHRAPSVLFRLISPTNPTSQIEWVKQNAVKSVRSKLGRDKDGNASTSITTDTIEIYASFDSAPGYFGLTSYLRYANEQIRLSFEIAKASRSETTRQYQFPWRKIDDSNIKVEGFIKKHFSFEVDQDKILDLLIGHTLYNDSNIVVRELVQNAIDAVRLQSQIDRSQSDDVGKVSIYWNTKARELTITDNGTGMTQEVIENHLLKVGSSRYQEPKFKDEFPNFSPISRFGIGVLSSFMVADNVEILTVNTAEDQARRITLESVHGKYLISLLDKNNTEVKRIGLHGTSFKLKFRSTAKQFDMLRTVQSYIFFPRCKVEVVLDKASPVHVGYSSPKEALQAYIDDSRVSSFYGDQKVRVVEETRDGLMFAYALKYNSHFRDWSFVTMPRNHDRDEEKSGVISPIVTCVEGIAVDTEIPGFRGSQVLATTNLLGLSAPRTNVARSQLESTKESEDAAKKVYQILFSAVETERLRLQEEEGYSLTWALSQMAYLLGPIVSFGTYAIYQNEHQGVMEQVRLLLIEKNNDRQAGTIQEIRQAKRFCTVESALMNSVELFIKEASSEVTASKLISISQNMALTLPSEIMVANYNSIFNILAKKFEVAEINGDVTSRQAILIWEENKGSWLSEAELAWKLQTSSYRESARLTEFIRTRSTHASQGRTGREIFVARSNVKCTGLKEFSVLAASGSTLILPNTFLANVILQEHPEGQDSISDIVRKLLFIHTTVFLSGRRNHDVVLAERYLKQFEEFLPDNILPSNDEFLDAVARSQNMIRTFNPFSWDKRES